MLSLFRGRQMKTNFRRPIFKQKIKFYNKISCLEIYWCPQHNTQLETKPSPSNDFRKKWSASQQERKYFSTKLLNHCHDRNHFAVEFQKKFWTFFNQSSICINTVLAATFRITDFAIQSLQYLWIINKSYEKCWGLSENKLAENAHFSTVPLNDGYVILDKFPPIPDRKRNRNVMRKNIVMLDLQNKKFDLQLTYKMESIMWIRNYCKTVWYKFPYTQTHAHTDTHTHSR